MDENIENIPKIFSSFSKCISKPETFLGLQDDVAEQLRKTTKKLYDLTKSLKSTTKNGALSKLIVDNFDDEQVWQQIELQNDPTVTEIISSVARLSAAKDWSFIRKRRKKEDLAEPDEGGRKKKKVKENNNIPSDMDEEDEDDEHDEDDANDEDDRLRLGTDDEDDLSDEEKMMEELLKKASENATNDDYDDDDEDDEDNDFDLDTASLAKSLAKSKSKSEQNDDVKITTKPKGVIKKRKTVVDDKFFNMADMEMFLEQEDAKEERKQSGKMEEENSEDEIDYFADIPDDDDCEDGGGNLKYNDFFDPPDQETNTDTGQQKKNVKFTTEEMDDFSDNEIDDGNDDDEGEEEDEDKEEEEEEEGEDITEVIGGAKKERSTFEKRQERLKAKIHGMEEVAMTQKPWQLKGEVSSQTRPENSLLEEDLDFEHTTRMAPEITEETTKSLEDIIKQRIKDKAYDDVERQVKISEGAGEYKKRVVLDQDKSKLSLGQIYEQEYLKQQKREEEDKTEPQHEEITKSMTALFLKLDALSNFHYTPKPAAPEVKIVSNLPSITMEEVAPIATSENTLLAPEEIQAKPKTEVKGVTEKSETDRKRERLDKKKRQQAHYKHREEKQKILEKKGLTNKKRDKEKALKELKKKSRSAKGISVIEDDKNVSSKLTSSTQFFSQLQEEVSAHVISKKAAKKRAKQQKDPAAKYKL